MKGKVDLKGETDAQPMKAVISNVLHIIPLDIDVNFKLKKNEKHSLVESRKKRKNKCIYRTESESNID